MAKEIIILRYVYCTGCTDNWGGIYLSVISQIKTFTKQASIKYT